MHDTCPRRAPGAYSTAARWRQNSQATRPRATTSAAPNSPVHQAVGPVSTVTGSKKPWTKRLCEAWRMAAGYKLAERNRNQAIGHEMASTMRVKQTRA